MNKPQSKILITGSSGFLGSACSKFLKQKGVQVVSYDVRQGHIYDVRDFKQLKSRANGVEGIIHTAGISRPKQVFQNPSEGIDINIRGTLNVLEAARNEKNNPWVIFVSSREIFGDNPGHSVTEASPRDIKDVYVASKIACENLCEAYSRQYGTKARVVRFSNLYTDSNDFLDRVVPKFIISVSKNEDIKIGGSGNESFDFVYILDAVNALWKVVKEVRRRRVPYDDFNIISGDTLTLPQAARLIIEKMGSSSKIRINHENKAAVSNFYGDYSKARKILGYHPKFTFKRGVGLAIEEFREVGIIK